MHHYHPQHFGFTADSSWQTNSILNEFSFANMETNMELSSTTATSIIGFLDVDGFECQLYQRDHPEYRGKPCVVVNVGGRVVAVSHEAKKLGISRLATPTHRDIKRKCPKAPIKVFYKANRWGKQDSTKTRHATWELVDAVKEFCQRFGNDIPIELAASDEIYLDISTIITEFIRKDQQNLVKISDKVIWEKKKTSKKGPFTYDLCYKDKLRLNGNNFLYRVMKEQERLVLGAKFMDSLIGYIYQQTKLQCSGGVSNNKLLAKVGCGINKPSKITILDSEGFKRLSRSVKVTDIPGLGGQGGEKLMGYFGCKTVLDLKKIPIDQLKSIFDDDSSERYFSFARGIDNCPVTMRLVKQAIRCNKPSGAIYNIKKFEEALENLICEIETMLDEEAMRHKRKPTEIKLEMTLGSTRFDGEDEKKWFLAREVQPLYNNAMKTLLDLTRGFKVTELGIVARNFIPLDDSFDSLNSGDVSQEVKALQIARYNPVPPNNELRVKVKPQINVPTPIFTNRTHIGEFRTMNGKEYSTANVKLPVLRSLEEIMKFVGRHLGEGYGQRTVGINDHTEYYELKHKCFIRLMKETNIFGNNNCRKPTFVGFSGRFADPLQTVCKDNHGDWSFYATNVNNVVWIWDEKLPRRSDIYSYFGANFERIATNHDPNSGVNEGDMIYQVDQVDFGKHSILLVNQVDAVKENGSMIEITQLGRGLTFAKALRLWSQLTIHGVSKVLIGVRNEKTGILQSVSESDVSDLINTVGVQNVEQCLHFQNRLLDFVQSHLNESNPKVVKRFSWIPGAPKVNCEDIPERNISTLVFHRLYSEFLNF